MMREIRTDSNAPLTYIYLLYFQKTFNEQVRTRACIKIALEARTKVTRAILYTDVRQWMVQL